MLYAIVFRNIIMISMTITATNNWMSSNGNISSSTMVCGRRSGQRTVDHGAVAEGRNALPACVRRMRPYSHASSSSINSKS